MFSAFKHFAHLGDLSEAEFSGAVVVGDSELREDGSYELREAGGHELLEVYIFYHALREDGSLELREDGSASLLE